MSSRSTNQQRPEHVMTLLPDDEYDALKAELEARHSRSKFERFAGDERATKIWLTTDGRILSQMPPEPYVKQIIPSSKGGLGNLIAGSGFAKTVDRFAQSKNVSRELASALLIKLYNRHEIPKSVELPDELLATIEIGKVTGIQPQPTE